MSSSGYLHPGYAAALSHQGVPRELGASGGWLLARPIPGSERSDACGPYPLFCCRSWDALADELPGLRDEFVSVGLVTDPFGDYTEAQLRAAFPDVCFPFKQHYVTDLAEPADQYVSRHHRRNADRAGSVVAVEHCTRPAEWLDDWTRLYAVLTDRHAITGPAAFSRESFTAQFAVPGLEAFRASSDDTTVGMLLWYVQGPVAYYHLGAYSDEGYRLKASFALFAAVIRHFEQTDVRYLDLGAGAGLAGDASDGLSRFKSGWSTATRPAYFCGRVLDPEAYAELTGSRDHPGTGYFPAYRRPSGP